MILADVFYPQGIKTDLESEDKDELFEEMVHMFLETQKASFSADVILTALHHREDRLSTGIKRGIALPHASIPGLSRSCGLIGISKQGIEYDALDGEPVHLVFMLFSAKDEHDTHLQILKRLAELLQDPNFTVALYSQTTPDDVYGTLCRYEKILSSEE